MSEAFTRVLIDNREDWLKERMKHIQASEAGIITGDSPWHTATELWSEKLGLTEPEDISDKPYVIYGKKMEPFIREQVLLDLPYFTCEYHEFDILVNKDRPWQACTLDGELTVITEDNPWGFPIGTKGILECKTGSWRNKTDLDKWLAFPETYRKQQLHQLAVTEWDFNLSASRIKRDAYYDDEDGLPSIRTIYHMVRADDSYYDIIDLNRQEEAFWESIQTKTAPLINFI